MGSGKIKTGRFRSNMGVREESYVLHLWKGVEWSHRETQLRIKAEKSAIQKEAEINMSYTEQSFISEWFNKSYIRCSQHGPSHVSRFYHEKSVYCSQNVKVEC